MMSNHRRHTSRGFTLTELVIATTLMSIAMIGVYSSFHSTILHWRNGSANEKTYHDARRVFTIVQNDLASIPNDRRGLDASTLFFGGPEEFEFVATILPMNVEEQAIESLYNVRYVLDGSTLIREESPLIGPLPVRFQGYVESDGPVELPLGDTYGRVIADDVLALRVTYLWTPLIGSKDSDTPSWRPLIKRPTATHRLPAGLMIEMILLDPAKDPSNPGTRFTKTIRFDGRVSSTPDDLESGDA
jgi:prepilin-type N-terminal cleavage/methylation domain-containing protein